jgi:hypothetical protein
VAIDSRCDNGVDCLFLIVPGGVRSILGEGENGFSYSSRTSGLNEYRDTGCAGFNCTDYNYYLIDHLNEVLYSAK